MHKYLYKQYYFIEKFDKNHLKKINKKINLIYRNYSKVHDERTIKNLANSYKKSEVHWLDLHVRDSNAIYKPVRRSLGLTSLRFDEAYYRIRDTRTDDVIVPFTKLNNATRISSDSTGMYFKLSTKNWPKGRSYTIDVMVVEDGKDKISKTGKT